MAMMALGGCIGWDGPAECILGFCDIVTGSLISQQNVYFYSNFCRRYSINHVSGCLVRLDVLERPTDRWIM